LAEGGHPDVILIYLCTHCGHLVSQDESFVKEGQLERDPPTPPLWGPTGGCRMCGQGTYVLWGRVTLPIDEAYEGRPKR